jgi:hypothetical protein
MHAVLRTLLVGCSLAVIANASASDSPPSSQAAPEPVPSSSATALNTITVEGKREVVEKQINDFVTSVMVHSDRVSLSRWRGQICPLVTGLPAELNDFVMARLTEIAGSVGAPAFAPPHCVANFYVIATSDPAALLKKWRARDPKMFGDRGEIAINSFVNTARPIRVWYNGIIVAAAGNPLQDRTLNTGQSVASSSTYYLTNNRAELSRLTWDDVVELSSVIEIIDTGQLKNITAGQLADYVAMVGLAEVHLDADVGTAPTVLHLFSHAGVVPQSGMSSWDQAFLQSLYNTSQEQRSQLSAIKTLMIRNMSP